MEERRRALVDATIAHCERLMEVESDPARLRSLRGVWAAARSEAGLPSGDGALENAGADMAALRQSAKRLRMRAEEYRVVADAMESEAVRSTYLYLARSYELLAERAEGPPEPGRRQEETA